MKKTLSILLAAAMITTIAVGCTKKDDNNGSAADDTSKGSSQQTETSFDTSKDISVISREDGSGTRGAFIELFGIEEKDADGNKVDKTIESAAVTNSTAVMMTSVSGNPYAIGYLSLGSLDETVVKALKVDGVEASVENIKNDTYKIARPFNIATKEGLSEVAQDFVSYIMSADGQAVIEEAGYIAVSDAPAYSGSKPSGKIVVAGSSSVTPAMEKLKEAYLAVNSNATIEIQQSDSTTGMNSAIEGICDIGMASRALKDSETEKGLTGTTIAMDGIAVIVNKENTMDAITSEQVKAIYTGEAVKWSDIIQ